MDWKKASEKAMKAVKDTDDPDKQIALIQASALCSIAGFFERIEIAIETKEK